jgi:hypothetical protein
MVRVIYIPRPEWDTSGAPRLGRVVPRSQFTGLAVHHTVTRWLPGGSVADAVERAKSHMRTLRTIRPDLGADVPYSFVVFRTPDPNVAIVAEGRGWERTGAHTQGNNSTRYGVAFAGNSSVDPVTTGVVGAYRWIGEHINASTVRAPIPHRSVSATECPGSGLMAVLDQLQPPYRSVTPPAPVEEEHPMDLWAYINDAYAEAKRPVGSDGQGRRYWYRTATAAPNGAARADVLRTMESLLGLKV